jgi:hypothetical protein
VNDADLFSPWDNFQCKKYDHRLTKTDVWLELGKLIYYTWKGEYTVPRKYYFCASRDVGSSLALLLRKPEELKSGLRAAWDKHCRAKIIARLDIPLEGDLLRYFDGFDLQIVSYRPVAELIEQHRKTRYFALRFGGGLPERPVASAPPADIAANEIVYTSALLAAYSEYLGTEVSAPAALAENELQRHFERSRREFYCAEGLRVFSEDHLPPREYGRLEDEVCEAIQDTVDDAVHANGYDRVRAVVRHAQLLQIDSHPLKSRMSSSDRAGICHQLANNGRVKWVKRK